MKKKVLIIAFIGLITIGILFKIFIIYNVSKKQVPVLVYHNIVLTQVEKKGDLDTLTVAEFEEQMKYLKECGYKTLTLDELYEWKINKKDISNKSVVITFDDGFYSFKYLVQPILEKYDFNATCFIIGDVTQSDTKDFSSENYGTIGKDEILNHIKNVEYASHTYGLHHLNENNEKYIKISTKSELLDDIKTFNENIVDTKYLAYPYYTYTNEYIKLLKQNGYKLAFAGEEEMATKKVNNYKVPRISGVKNFDEFKKIFETKNYKNKYGNGIIRKICIKIKRLVG